MPPPDSPLHPTEILPAPARPSAGLRIILWRLLKTLVGISILLGLGALLFPRQLFTVDSGNVQADVIVLLGGAPDGRADRAAELYHERAAPRILFSGDFDGKTFAHELESRGVPPGVISLEQKSRSTLENARLSVPLLRQMGAHRIIIVTSWYHSRRALACFRHFAPDLVFYSRPSYFGYARRDWGRYDLRLHISYEYPKTLGYWLLYGVPPF